MSGVKVNKHLDFQQDGEVDADAVKQRTIEELSFQIRQMTEKLAKLQGGTGQQPAPFGYTRVPTPLKNVVNDERMDLQQLSTSVAKVGQEEQGRMPDPKFLKSLKLKIFDGAEEYPELGPNFGAWRADFVQEVCLAQRMSGYEWAEDIKLIVLKRFLGGPVLTYFNAHKAAWPVNCDEVLNALQVAFTSRITHSKGYGMLRKQKPKDRSWDDHWVYMIAVVSRMPAGNYGDVLVETLVLHASPEMSSQLLTKYDPGRQDYAVHASEIVQFAKRMEAQQGKTYKKNQVNNVSDKVCFKCGRAGHIARNCPPDEVASIENVFNVNASRTGDDCGQEFKIKWVLDSGAAIHMTNRMDVLQGVKEFTKTVCVADQRELKLRASGTVCMFGWNGTGVSVSDVHYHPDVKNLLSLGSLEAKGCVLLHEGNQKWLINQRTKEKIARVKTENGLSVLEMRLMNRGPSVQNKVESVFNVGNVHVVEKCVGQVHVGGTSGLAKESRSEIKLADAEVQTCESYAKFKSKKESDRTAEGVIKRSKVLSKTEDPRTEGVQVSSAVSSMLGKETIVVNVYADDFFVAAVTQDRVNGFSEFMSAKVVQKMFGIKDVMDKSIVELIQPSKLFLSDYKRGIRQVVRKASSSSAILKYVNMRCKFGRDREKGQVGVDYVKSEGQVEDMLTKPNSLVKLSKSKSSGELGE